MSSPFDPQHGLVIVQAAVDGPSGSAVLTYGLSRPIIQGQMSGTTMGRPGGLRDALYNLWRYPTSNDQ
jgi:hypothetical protein